MISRIWQSQKIKTVFTKGTKAALHFQLQETGLVDKGALENAATDFQLIMEHTVRLPWRCIHKNQRCVEIKALWIHSIHFHIGKPFQRNHGTLLLEGQDRIPSTDHQSLVGVKLWRKTPLKYYFLPYLITKQIYFYRGQGRSP